jgi:hypothetical protein
VSKSYLSDVLRRASRGWTRTKMATRWPHGREPPHGMRGLSPIYKAGGAYGIRTRDLRLESWSGADPRPASLTRYVPIRICNACRLARPFMFGASRFRETWPQNGHSCKGPRTLISRPFAFQAEGSGFDPRLPLETPYQGGGGRKRTSGFRHQNGLTVIVRTLGPVWVFYPRDTRGSCPRAGFTRIRTALRRQGQVSPSRVDSLITRTSSLSEIDSASMLSKRDVPRLPCKCNDFETPSDHRLCGSVSRCTLT